MYALAVYYEDGAGPQAGQLDAEYLVLAQANFLDQRDRLVVGLDVDWAATDAVGAFFHNIFAVFSTKDLLTMQKQYAIIGPHRQSGLIRPG